MKAAHHCKYAKWKAAYLHKCLKTGETPVPGPAGGDDYTGEAEGGAAPYPPYPTNTQQPPGYPTSTQQPPYPTNTAGLPGQFPSHPFTPNQPTYPMPPGQPSIHQVVLCLPFLLVFLFRCFHRHLIYFQSSEEKNVNCRGLSTQWGGTGGGG